MLWETREQAVSCPRGDLFLAHCGDCGFIANTAFDPSLADYTQTYDNALHYSAVFRAFARELASGLVERHGLRGKRVVEIGCGDGHFLHLLCELGDNRGVGFDPSHAPRAGALAGNGRARILREHYTEASGRHPADLVCCRQVLEHIARPREFVEMVRASLRGRPGTTVYFEVPNMLLPLRRLSFWDLIYEHPSHFIPATLERLFHVAGFEVTSVGETYAGQFVSLEARPARGPARPAPRRARELAALAADVRAARDRLRARTAAWRRRVDALRASDGTLVAWGAGSKAVSFFNFLDIRDEIPRVVDLNPCKQGHHLPGTGQRIVAPEELADDPPAVVIAMNPIYVGEIRQQLSLLGVPARVEAL